MHPLLTEAPPYTEAPVLCDQRILPEAASMAYIGPVGCVDPAKRTPLAMVTGPLEVALLGLAVDHRVSPVLASIATHPPAVVIASDGLRVKFLPLLLTMLV